MMSLSEKYIHSKLYIVLFLFILIGCGQPDLQMQDHPWSCKVNLHQRSPQHLHYTL